MNDEKVESNIAYICGRIEAQLEGFAQSLGLPPAQLTTRVATLLLSMSGGLILGPKDRVSDMPRKTTKKYKVRSSKVAVARRTPSKTSAGIKAYWAKMTAEERSAEMTRRSKVKLSKKGKS